jgi:hypothetical protein
MSEVFGTPSSSKGHTAQANDPILWDGKPLNVPATAARCSMARSLNDNTSSRFAGA